VVWCPLDTSSFMAASKQIMFYGPKGALVLSPWPVLNKGNKEMKEIRDRNERKERQRRERKEREREDCSCYSHY
jgi:hypothetical protein